MQKYIYWSCILLSLLLLQGCQQAERVTGELRVGVAQLPMSLDPRFATDAASHKIQALIYRGLIHLDAGFVPQADIAKAWQHPDALTWVFDLRDDVYFHNGVQLTSADVVATLQSVLNKDLASPLRAGFSAIASLEAVGRLRVKITLHKPDSSFLTRLSLGILPKSWLNKPQQAHQSMGTGAFQLQAWRGNDLYLQRVLDSPSSNIQVLHFIRVKDAVTRCLKLVRGEIDFTQNDLPPDLLPYLKKQPNLSIQTHASTTFSYIGLNVQDAYLKDVRVRRALALAIDRPRLIKSLLSSLPISAETVLTPEHWAASTLEKMPFDKQKAEVLLDAAGFPRNKQGVRFGLVYRTSTDPSRLRLATAIADMWQQIGVQVSLESLEWGGFYARIKRGDFQVFSLSWVSIVDPDIYRWILHSEMWPPKGANRGRYSDKQMDTWLEAASAQENTAKRQALYAKIERKMQQEQVYIPLWYDAVVAVSSKRLSGFHTTAGGGFLGLLEANFQ